MFQTNKEGRGESVRGEKRREGRRSRRKKVTRELRVGWGGGGRGVKHGGRNCVWKKHGYGEERTVVCKKKNIEGFI